MSQIISINPATEELIARYDYISKEEIDQKIKKAEKTFYEWKKVSGNEKKQYFLNLAELIQKEKSNLADLESKEMGMPYHVSYQGIDKSVGLIKWFAENFQDILKEQYYQSEGVKVKSQYDPLGVIYGIAPWNFPFNQVLRAAVPNILAGNTTIYKHAENVPLCGEKLEELFKKAGFPDGVYQDIKASTKDTEYIISQKAIAGVNLTGSENAGSIVGSLAGKYLKPSVLELGGNDAFIVADTSDLSGVAKEAVKARVSNCGQKCNSSKRFIVRESEYDKFCEYFKEHMENLIVGDPMDSNTQVGPIARQDLRDKLHYQVQQTIQQGAKLLTGGYKMEGSGYYYAPTVLADVTSGMTSYQEELFGPVASIIKVKDLDEAVEVANNSDFGLCGCVYGDDINQTVDIASRIHTGMVFINQPAGSKASLPFGGVKKSGYGKENGPEGLKAFTNKKVIVYNPQEENKNNPNFC
ncbi:aldehyde dehydrogenase family protein [Candidatus Absconditicoccus praedator]|uniref:aldehyde dehydrogenase family protein n=1 Tax=Candidatus Absconditicoccus praedator TaxID=2735562 RepID=UPI001E2F7D26|nr:aldehyde dehydrogenase family protein [Candidatus Absconditicoccus praedator]UFX83137.1 aldehyde dehydrogenase family protein [Candidatus Absconditicoccus praedator]